MSTQTLCSLIVISWSFHHQPMIFACVSLGITSTPPQIMKIRHCNVGFSCLSGALGKRFWFIAKKGFACCKCTAFEHSRVDKHPSLCALPALLLLPFLPALQEHKFLAVDPFSGVLMQKHLYLVRGTYGLGDFNERRRTVLQQGAHLPFLSHFQRAKPCSQRGIATKRWACVSSWNFTLSLLCRMWVTYLGFKEPCCSTLKP